MGCRATLGRGNPRTKNSTGDLVRLGKGDSKEDSGGEESDSELIYHFVCNMKIFFLKVKHFCYLLITLLEPINLRLKVGNRVIALSKLTL